MVVGPEGHVWHGRVNMARFIGKKLEGTPTIYVLQCSSKRTVHLRVRGRWFCEDCFQEALFVDMT